MFFQILPLLHSSYHGTSIPFCLKFYVRTMTTHGNNANKNMVVVDVRLISDEIVKNFQSEIVTLSLEMFSWILAVFEWVCLVSVLHGSVFIEELSDFDANDPTNVALIPRERNVAFSSRPGWRMGERGIFL